MIDNLKTQPEEAVYNLVEKRYLGLQKLRELLGDDAIEYRQDGGYELFLDSNPSLWEECINQIDKINQWLFPIFNDKVYSIHKNDFGFKQTLGIIKTPFEGNIHVGNMMKAFIEKVTENKIPILYNTAVTSFTDTQNGVEIELAGNRTFKAKKIMLCTNAFTNQLYDLDIVPARGQVLITKPLKHIPFQGNFHIREGFYYFRNLGDRILFGGGRILDFEGETTTEFGLTEQIQNQLESYIREVIIPQQDFEIDHRWSGIMAMGKEKLPIIEQLSENVYCGVRLSGMGVALGTLVGKEVVDLLT